MVQKAGKMIKIFHMMNQVQIKDHMYYATVEGQVLILDMNFCDFFIWTPLVNTNVENTLQFVFSLMQNLY